MTPLVIEQPKLGPPPITAYGSRRFTARLEGLPETYRAGTQVQIRAHEPDARQRGVGLGLTLGGGSLTFMGGFLGAFGCMVERRGLCIGGTAVAGLALATLAVGILNMRRAVARAEVRPRALAWLGRRPVIWGI